MLWDQQAGPCSVEAQLWAGPASCQKGLLYSVVLIVLVELPVRVVLTGNYLGRCGGLDT